MTLFLLRRLALLVVAFFVTSVVVFLLLRLLPGDLARVVGGTDAPPERIEALRETLGLNRSLVEQYLDWIGGILSGDFGTSALNGASVTDELGTEAGGERAARDRLDRAVDPGRGTARHRRRRPSPQGRRAGLVGGQPTRHRAADVLGRPDARHPVRRPLADLPGPGVPDRRVERPRAMAIRSLVLPTITLALAQGAVLMRFVRSATLDVLHQEYIRTARAKGLTRTQALFRHGLRNASLPIVSILGVQVASLIAGVVVIERVFALPGVGQMLLKDVNSRDLEKVQGTVLLIAVIVLVIGFVVDVLHRLADPRLRTGP